MFLSLKVKPNSSKDSLERDVQGHWVARIRAVPEKGKANDYLCAFLAAEWNLPRTNIDVVKGHRTSHKTIRIITDDEHFLEHLEEQYRHKKTSR
ncbi:MAG: DUF167 domain-containing protein [Cytophagaceae bacterium]|jgi:hypothetical protein|nr:DUF167 domain-containing protein [Cytophagaceae bacterium]